MRRVDPFHEMRGALSLIALGFASVLIVGYTGSFSAHLDLFSHFRVHVSVGLVTVGMMLAALHARSRAFGCLVLGIAGLLSLLAPLYLNAVKPTGGEAGIKIVGFNILYVNETPEDIAAMLEAERPDIAVIMEAPTLYPYLDRLKRTFPYHSGCTTRWWCDLLVLSRHPLNNIRRPGPAQFWDRYVLSSVDIAGQVVTLAAAHFSKPYSDGLALLEMRDVAKRVRNTDGPLIMTGDFNATPWSESIQVFVEEAGISPVAGYRPTWPGWAGSFGFPIDHVLVRDIVPVSIELIEDTLGSNHLGTISTFRVEP